MGLTEIKMLLKLYEKPLNKTNLAKIFWRIKKSTREEILKNLMLNNLIYAKEMPKPKTKKTPIYYFLTEKGTIWISNYIMHLP
ncbi:MAG: hypothetical protein PVI75_06575 [Gammaproteobacteria bacterium]|jgi:hypothetical protein